MAKEKFDKTSKNLKILWPPSYYLHCFTKDRYGDIFLPILHMKKHLNLEPFWKYLNRTSHHSNFTFNKIWDFKIFKTQIFKSNFSHDFPLERTQKTFFSAINWNISFVQPNLKIIEKSMISETCLDYSAVNQFLIYTKAICKLNLREYTQISISF